jgi:hypothetical protein
MYYWLAWVPPFLSALAVVRAVITCLKVKRLLLMSMDSLLAWLPVKACLSLPARSTIYNLDVIMLSGFFTSIYSTVRESIV